MCGDRWRLFTRELISSSPCSAIDCDCLETAINREQIQVFLLVAVESCTVQDIGSSYVRHLLPVQAHPAVGSNGKIWHLRSANFSEQLSVQALFESNLPRSARASEENR